MRKSYSINSQVIKHLLSIGGNTKMIQYKKVDWIKWMVFLVPCLLLASIFALSIEIADAAYTGECGGGGKVSKYRIAVSGNPGNKVVKIIFHNPPHSPVVDSIHEKEIKDANDLEKKIRDKIGNKEADKLKKAGVIKKALERLGLKCSVCKIGIKIGGISTNLSAQLLENLTDIKAVVYDPYLGDLIFVGERNYSLPKINVSDLVNALTITKDQQKLSIELGENTCPVDYYGTSNTSLGLKLFNADYLLKNKTIDYISDCYCDAACVDTSGYRIWIESSNVSLKTANNAFVYDTVKISAYSENLGSATVLSAQSAIFNPINSNFTAKPFGTPFGVKINKVIVAK